MPTANGPAGGPTAFARTRHAEIPRGVADYFWTEAYTRRQLEATLLQLFRTWAYEDVIPPMFEYADTYQGRSSTQLQQEMYRFLDRDGSMLALRADMTIPVARLVGVRLHDRPMPQRYCYAGSVFRHIETQAGRQREFWQAGCELVGASSPEADAEIMALTAAALCAAGLNDFRLVVGQIQYFHGLLQALDLDPPQTATLQHAIDRNSEAQLAEFLAVTPLSAEQRRTVEGLPGLSGADVPAILTRAEQLCLNSAMQGALANLRAIYNGLSAYGVAGAVYVDLTEIHNLGYYTGITFEVLTHQLGFPIGSGGRYDNLVGSFGAPQPAVGVALGVDRILLARTIQDQTPHATHPVGPDLLVATQSDAACFAIIHDWRQAGLRVAVSLEETSPATLLQQARQMGARYAVAWTGASFQIMDARNPAAAAEELPASASDQMTRRVRAGHAAALPVR